MTRSSVLLLSSILLAGAAAGCRDPNPTFVFDAGLPASDGRPASTGTGGASADAASNADAAADTSGAAGAEGGAGP